MCAFPACVLLALLTRLTIFHSHWVRFIFDITGAKMCWKTEKHVEWTNNVQCAVAVALYCIHCLRKCTPPHSIGHHKMKSALASVPTLFSLSSQFMVTLQMSIILWLNRCCSKWWDFYYFFSHSLAFVCTRWHAHTLSSALHCLWCVWLQNNNYTRCVCIYAFNTKYKMLHGFMMNGQYAVDVKITQLLLHFVENW